ncbi:FAD:protein FMN transferase [Coraliomargarita algicola]|uniref:FAD:protein FMN transferase n=1 Tax=Coraliomargarita algicola TaxID=3092156 RepID=A0ABZ0RL89_9BACT|nr:FAD:protein FMN transferase [Coraliomargarita sp. J2-16]WPJ96213.1 FAD:protein FMN transferase [Coraliomargarita sp. J2-16]
MSLLHTYTHEAMKTTFSLRLISNDPALANSAASACIARIDAIEASLSRYIEGSDIWQINQMESDQSLFVSEDCHACLRLALEAGQETQGLFDCSLGRLIEHTKQAQPGERPKLSGQLMLDPNRPAVHCIERGREIDLGGIGKGYALDQLQITLNELGIKCALLAAGASTQLAFGERTWDIALGGDNSTLTIQLKNQALSSSGTAIQGSHIVSLDPNFLNYSRPRVWVIHSSAAKADAYSTAALLTPRLKSLKGLHSSVRFFEESTNGIVES